MAVEAAIDASGGSPVIDELGALRGATNRNKRARYQDLLERLEQYANYGDLDIPTELRQIQGDIWEIKTAEDRILFYRTEASNHHRSTVRLLYAFAKSKGKTVEGKIPPAYIRRAEWVMKGDRAHDADSN
jgi:hypothetical protein